MTLLKELTKALNKVNGNTITLQDDRKYDEYYCKVCKDRVSEDKYNHKYSICFGCFYGEEL